MLLNVSLRRYFFQVLEAAIFFIVFTNSSLCQITDSNGRIEYRVNGNQLNIEGVFTNNTSAVTDVSYTLTLDKQSKSGNSSTNQSGEAMVPAQGTKILSKSTVDLSMDAVYKIHLVVQKEKIILADKELELKGSEIQKH